MNEHSTNKPSCTLSQREVSIIVFCFSGGNLPDVVKSGSFHQFLVDLHEKFGPIASFWHGEQYAVSIISPELLKQASHLFDRPSQYQSNRSHGRPSNHRTVAHLLMQLFSLRPSPHSSGKRAYNLPTDPMAVSVANFMIACSHTSDFYKRWTSLRRCKSSLITYAVFPLNLPSYLLIITALPVSAYVVSTGGPTACCQLVEYG